jgi:SAM-dependent methyltransferase
MHPPVPSALERAAHLMALVNGGAMAKAIAVAAELGLADYLKEGPKHSDELARLTGSHPSALHRLLQALVSLDLCHERDDGAFGLSACGELLQSDAPHSLRSWVLWCANHMGPRWEKLKYSVQTGQSVRKLTNGANDFGHLDRDAEAAAVFNAAMSGITSLVALEALRVYDFSKLRRIVDIGGGHGAFLAVLLQAHADLLGVLFDRPHAMPGARTTLAAAAVASRCEFVSGDFFDTVPRGADGYLLKAIVHDWDDDKSIAILRNCRRVMPDDGRLVVVERVLPERFQANPLHHAIARADLTMLVSLGGRERTEAEFARLFTAAGFRLSGVRATAMEYSVLEGIPC